MNTTIQDKLLVLGVGALLSAVLLALWTPRPHAAVADALDAGWSDAWRTQPDSSGIPEPAPEARHPVRFRAVRDAAGRLLEVSL